jgi:hypothetical protein
MQPHRTNSVEDTEFCTLAKLLKTELDGTTVGSTKFWWLCKTETPGLLNTTPLGNSLLFPIFHFVTPNSQWLTSYDYLKMVGMLNSGKSEQTWLSGINQDFGEISPWPLQKLYIQKTSLMNSAFRWLLIQPISTRGLVTTDFWIQIIVLDCSGQIGH